MYAPHLCSKLLLVAGSDVNLDYQDVISYIQAFRSSTGTSTTEPPSTSQRAVEPFMEVILKTTNELIAVSLGKKYTKFQTPHKIHSVEMHFNSGGNTTPITSITLTTCRFCSI